MAKIRALGETYEHQGTTPEEMTKEAVFSDYKLMGEKCAETDELRKKLEEYYDEWGSLE